MNKYVCQFSNVLNQTKCDNLIDIFEINDKKYETTLYANDIINCKQLKYKYTESFADSIINEVVSFINVNLDVYFEKCFKEYTYDYVCSDSMNITFEKYDSLCGFKISNANMNNNNNNIKFILYLNDVDRKCGGELVFNNDLYLQPTSGSLVLFPDIWCIRYIQNMPINNDVYVLTGNIIVT